MAALGGMWKSLPLPSSMDPEGASQRLFAFTGAQQTVNLVKGESSALQEGGGEDEWLRLDGRFMNLGKNVARLFVGFLDMEHDRCVEMIVCYLSCQNLLDCTGTVSCDLQQHWCPG